LTDILATSAQAAQCEFDKVESEDSFSFLDSAMGQAGSVRPSVINHSSAGTFAIRDGKWKLVMGSGSGGRQKPKGKAFERPYQLYDLTDDIGEQRNVINDHRDIESKLLKDFETLAHGDEKPKRKSNIRN
jgi:arylsulfatase A-like enzyme